jgi:hypothetical protein
MKVHIHATPVGPDVECAIEDAWVAIFRAELAAAQQALTDQTPPAHGRRHTRRSTRSDGPRGKPTE